MIVRPLIALLFLFVLEPASAGTITVPADVSVNLTAEPSTGLVSGQLITFTISATNHGPGSTKVLGISSSQFTSEFDLYSASSDCQGLGLVVADLEFGYFYYYVWGLTDGGTLEVGETRSCHLILALSPSAPAVLTFGFEIPSFFADINPSNNSASVTLRRALVEATPVPALSLPTLALLAGIFMLIGGMALSRRQPICRSRRWHRRSSLDRIFANGFD